MADSDPMTPPAAQANKPFRPISRERMALLFTVMLVTAAGNTAMQSVMPSIGTELGVDDVWISLAYTWSALLWVICAPIWARRSDRRGRKAMMAVGLAGFISSMALCGLVLWFGLNGVLPAALTLLFFAAARSLYGGFGSAAPPAVQAYVASRTPRAQRTEAMALIASSFGLGTVVGPALAPMLVFPATGLVGPFFAFALFAVIVLAALRLRLPNDDPAFAARGEVVGVPFSANSNPRVSGRDDEAYDERTAGTADTPAAQAGGHDDIPRLSWRDTRLRAWILAGLIGGHAQAAILGIIGFFILDRLGLRADPHAGTGPIGMVLMSGAIATLLAQWGLIPMLRLGPRASIMWGMALAIVGVGMVSLARDLNAIALGFAIASMGFGLYRPGFTSGASLAVSRREQGQIGGIVASLNGAAYIFAPAVGVWFYNYHESGAYIGICLLCASVLFLSWFRIEPDSVMLERGDARR